LTDLARHELQELGGSDACMVNRAFWKGRRVLLTVHTGFKGSWLSLWLTSMRAEVTGFALAPPTQPNLFEQSSAVNGLKSVIGDIRDYEHLQAVLTESRPEVILHLAAQSVVRRGYEDPIETYSSNVMGTVHVLEALRHAGQKCVVVNVTSDKCYENREWVWGYRENEPMGGHDPYSNSKGCAELVTGAYRDSFFPIAELGKHGVALASARAGNAIGGGDWTSHQLIPDLMRSFLAGKSCEIRNPLAQRPWQFVLEPLRGYLMLAERLFEDGVRYASGWNFGPVDTDAKPVGWIADELVRLWGPGAAWHRDVSQHPHEAHFLKLDASKAKVDMGWHPWLPLPKALQWIAEWYRAYQAGSDMRGFTLAQIQRYEACCKN